MTILKVPGLCALVGGAALLIGCGSTPGSTASLAPSGVDSAGAPAMATSATALSAPDGQPQALGGPGSSGGGKFRDGRTGPESDQSSDEAPSMDGASDDRSDEHPSSVLLRRMASKVEIEGLVAAVDVTAGTLLVNGLTILVPPTAAVRHGHVPSLLALIQPLDRVHIRAIRATEPDGTLEAREVIVQRREAPDEDHDSDDDSADDDSADDDSDDDVPPPAPMPN